MTAARPHGETMLKNAFLFAGSALALALLAPSLLPLLAVAPPPGDVARSVARMQIETPASVVSPVALSDGFREKTLLADRGGQYSVDALIEGESVHMLVDTGATMVAISADLASRLGVTPEPGKPKWTMHTANGDSTASPVLLKNVSLGSIYMNDVEALIVDRSAGEVNLLGESFLKRLASVEQRNGMLVLRQ